jgi:hypothetical protein
MARGAPGRRRCRAAGRSLTSTCCRRRRGLFKHGCRHPHDGTAKGLSRIGHRPGLHAAAGWAVGAAMLVVLIPIALVGVVLGCQRLFARKQGRDAP